MCCSGFPPCARPTSGPNYITLPMSVFAPESAATRGNPAGIERRRQIVTRDQVNGQDDVELIELFFVDRDAQRLRELQPDLLFDGDLRVLQQRVPEAGILQGPTR